MKRWLACLLITLFSMQALPLREVFKSMLKKSVTEQSADDSADEDLNKEADAKAKVEAAQDYLAPGFSFSSSQRFFAAQVDACLHRHSRLPAAHHFEVATPPPNTTA